MIPISVNALIILFWLVVGVATGIQIVAFGAAVRAKLGRSLWISCFNSLLLSSPFLLLWVGALKIAFERKDQMLETVSGTIIMAVTLVAAMSGQMFLFVPIFALLAIACLFFFLISPRLPELKV